MRIDVDKLRELFQGYAASRKPLNRKGCPSQSAIAGSFEPSASVRKKKRIVDHISACSFCREEFMMMLESQEHDAGSIKIKCPTVSYKPRRGAARVARSLGHSPLWQYASVLFGLVLVISSLFILVRQSDLSPVRRIGGSGIVLLYPKPGQSLSGPIVFRWQERLGSEFYVLELFDDALLPIWASDKIRDTQILLPPDISSNLNPGKPYFWMVTALSHNSKMAESTLARFQILR
jgi:hypothetical protein